MLFWGRRVTLIRRHTIPGDRFFYVLRHPAARVIHEAQVVLRACMAPDRRLEVPPCGFRGALENAQAAGVHHAQIVLGAWKPLVGSRAIPVLRPPGHLPIRRGPRRTLRPGCSERPRDPDPRPAGTTATLQPRSPARPVPGRTSRPGCSGIPRGRGPPPCGTSVSLPVRSSARPDPGNTGFPG